MSHSLTALTCIFDVVGIVMLHYAVHTVFTDQSKTLHFFVLEISTENAEVYSFLHEMQIFFSWVLKVFAGSMVLF